MKNFEKYSYLLATDQVESLTFSNSKEAKEFAVFHCLELVEKEKGSNWSEETKKKEEFNIRCILENRGRISSVDFLSPQKDDSLYFLILKGNVCSKQY